VAESDSARRLQMRFEWDENKNRENRKKHGVSFEIAMEVFDDPFSLTSQDRMVEGEERLWTLGRVDDLNILVVVHTVMDERDEEVIRIISARKATPRERAFYEEVDG
jgi:uncharacterized DUF497 family protein